MGKLEEFVVCSIRGVLTKITLKTYQPHIINRTNQGSNKGVKSLMTFNTPDKPHKGVVLSQETDT